MRESTAAGYHERIVRTLIYIQQHLDEPLELDRLAGVACFSPFHFHRIFRALVGEPVQEHVRRLRLERAAQSLKLQNRPITDIAFDAGYDSHEAFTRAFHAMFGLPPSQFRSTHETPAGPLRGGTAPPAHSPSVVTGQHGQPIVPESPSGVHFAETAGYRPPDYGAPPAVEIKSLPPQRVVFLRHRGSYDQVGATWGRLAAWAGMRGLFGPATRMIGICWDDPQITPADKVRYDAAITIDCPVEPEGEIGVTEIAGGDYATLVHKGPYETLGAAYHALLGAWLPSSGREMRDAPCFEVYLNSPQFTKPEDLLTVIHAPV